jgi:hypothetical protein
MTNQTYSNCEFKKKSKFSFRGSTNKLQKAYVRKLEKEAKKASFVAP